MKKKNKVFKNIHWQVFNAIQRGAIKRGKCELCGSNKNVEGHHEDYDKPLQVRWLCRKHHRSIHKRAAVKVSYVAVRIYSSTHRKLKIRAAKLEISIPKLIDAMERIY